MISVFDMFSIGIGPSSSHTVGPMRAAKTFCRELSDLGLFDTTDEIMVELFGSLGQTGKGHGTGKAVILGLLGYAPETIDSSMVETFLEKVSRCQRLNLDGKKTIKFPALNAIVFHRRKSLSHHPNGMTFHAMSNKTVVISQTYFSIGGGFIIREQDFSKQKVAALIHEEQSVPFDFSSAKQLLELSKEHGMRISSIMMKNEEVFQSKAEIVKKLWHIWQVMYKSVQTGIKTEGILPGGLKVMRRAPGLYNRLQNEKNADPMVAMHWVNLFALAVN